MTVGRYLSSRTITVRATLSSPSPPPARYGPYNEGRWWDPPAECTVAVLTVWALATPNTPIGDDVGSATEVYAPGTDPTQVLLNVVTPGQSGPGTAVVVLVGASGDTDYRLVDAQGQRVDETRGERGLAIFALGDPATDPDKPAWTGWAIQTLSADGTAVSSNPVPVPRLPRPDPSPQCLPPTVAMTSEGSAQRTDAEAGIRAVMAPVEEEGRRGPVRLDSVAPDLSDADSSYISTRLDAARSEFYNMTPVVTATSSPKPNVWAEVQWENFPSPSVWAEFEDTPDGWRLTREGACSIALAYTGSQLPPPGGGCERR